MPCSLHLWIASTMCCHFCENSAATGAASGGLNPGTGCPSGTPCAAASPRLTNDTCGGYRRGRGGRGALNSPSPLAGQGLDPTARRRSSAEPGALAGGCVSVCVCGGGGPGALPLPSQASCPPATPRAGFRPQHVKAATKDGLSRAKEGRPALAWGGGGGGLGGAAAAREPPSPGRGPRGSAGHRSTAWCSAPASPQTP